MILRYSINVMKSISILDISHHLKVVAIQYESKLVSIIDLKSIPPFENSGNSI